MQNRFRGCLLGLACGDAVGTTVEFRTRGSFTPVTDMVGGGPFGLLPGQWTDDTSMALCLATSLVESRGFDPRDQIERYLCWKTRGYLSSTGHCFDIGNTVASALRRYQITNDPFSGPTAPHTAGNGSLMRLAPVPMYFVHDLAKVIHYSGKSSRTTHGTKEAIDACQLFGVMVALALCGEPKNNILFDGPRTILSDAKLAPSIADIATGSYRAKRSEAVRGSGYVVASLEAALWSFYHSDNFGDAILRAVNLGDDADTTAAICGQIAGAYYGIEAIPEGWLKKLAMKDDIEEIADRLYKHRGQT